LDRLIVITDFPAGGGTPQEMLTELVRRLGSSNWKETIREGATATYVTVVPK
jgi:hypothetical protein